MLAWLKRCVFKHGFDIPVFFFQPTVTSLRSYLEQLWTPLPVHWRVTSPCTRAELTRYRRGSERLSVRRMGCGQKSTCTVGVSTPFLLTIQQWPSVTYDKRYQYNFDLKNSVYLKWNEENCKFIFKRGFNMFSYSKLLSILLYITSILFVLTPIRTCNMC